MKRPKEPEEGWWEQLPRGGWYWHLYLDGEKPQPETAPEGQLELW